MTTEEKQVRDAEVAQLRERAEKAELLAGINADVVHMAEKAIERAEKAEAVVETLRRALEPAQEVLRKILLSGCGVLMDTPDRKAFLPDSQIVNANEVARHALDKAKPPSE